SRRRHTRFSRDWSSDVCSSDLVDAGNAEAATAKARAGADYETFTSRYPGLTIGTDAVKARIEGALDAGADYVILYVPGLAHDDRSEERRVGKGCRSRGSPGHRR